MYSPRWSSCIHEMHSINAFVGKGKLVALKMAKKEAVYQECFNELWRACFCRTLEQTQNLHMPSIRLQGDAVGCQSISLSTVLCKEGDVNPAQLPPCRDCLFQHAQRENYQAGLWRRSLECQPEVPRPTDCRWTTDDDGSLEILWMTGPPVPPAVLEPD